MNEKSEVKETIDKYISDGEIIFKNKYDIDETMNKYLSSSKMNEEQQGSSPLVNLIRSKINTQEPNKIICLGNILSLTGLSMILQDDRTRNVIQQGVRSLLGKM
jgi:hypothetical protein